MADETYEGWSNRETWAVALMINNNQGLYHATNGMARTAEDSTALADAIETMFDEMHDDVLNGTANVETRRIILSVGSLGRVDWHEVAADIREAATA